MISRCQQSQPLVIYLSMVFLLALILSGCNPDDVAPSNPAPAPTQVPTQIPTQIPTQVPTPVPTPVPTQVPSDNHQPGARITAPQSYISGQTVTLDGSGSSDPDDDRLSYQWIQIGGPNIVLSNTTSPILTFVAAIVAQPTQFSFQLTVSDGVLSSSASVSVQISPIDDVTSPSIVSRSPQVDQSGVAPNAEISVVFDEALLESSVESQSLVVRQNSNPVAGNVSYDSSNFTLSYKPAADLSAGLGYTVTLDNSLTDLAGNTFAGESWSFITGVCATANDGSNLTLSCPSGQVINEVNFASYGTPGGSCGSFSKSSCDASNSMTIVAVACKGMDICTLNVDSTIFGEPCKGSDKHLAVQVTCGIPAPAGDVTKTIDLQAAASGNSVKLSWSLRGITPRTQEIMRGNDPDPGASSRIGVASSGNEFIDYDVKVGESYYYWIKASDVDSSVTNSQVVSVTVTVPAIPGRLEAEAYDSFLDTTTGNTGGEFRRDDVDIEATADQGGGFNVGWITPGEYLRYHINVAESAGYKLTLRVASPYSNKQLMLKLDDKDISGALTVPNSGDFQNWRDLSFNARLVAGVHQLEVYFLTDGINFNYIDLAIDDSVTTDPANWTLVWSDEFNGDTIDLSKWEHEVNATGGGNNELQYYTGRSQNSWVSDGLLHIQALNERYSGPEGTRNFTSARLRTLNKGDWKYGRFEVRAKLPQGQGMWPAIWMLPTDWVYGGWAASGEIDIMEAVNLKGAGGNTIYGTLHYGAELPNNIYSGDQTEPSTSVVDEFHNYALEWDENEIRWYIDGVHYQTQNNWSSTAAPYPAPFNQRFHMILNLAVGGDWPGSPDSSTQFPQSMDVDYVRVYRKD